MRYGIISDIHEDIVRLKEAVRILEKRNVDELICLGDMVGFSVPYYTYWDTRSANQVVDLVREECSDVVIGNHDLYAINRIPDHHRFFLYPKNWYSLDYVTRKDYAQGKVWLYDNDLPSCLTKENMEYLDSLPEYSVKRMGDHNVMLSHYAYPDLTGSSTEAINSASQLSDQFKFMEEHDCIYGFSANDHFEGFCYFSKEDEGNIRYSNSSNYILGNQLLWLHGPTVSRGEFNNGVLIYDSSTRLLEPVPLNSKTHKVIGEYIQF